MGITVKMAITGEEGGNPEVKPISVQRTMAITGEEGGDPEVQPISVQSTVKRLSLLTCGARDVVTKTGSIHAGGFVLGSKVKP